MRGKMISAIVLGAMFSAALVGCDETVSEKKDVDVKSDGTVVTKKEEVTKQSDGTVVTEKSKDVDKPADADHKDGDGPDAKVKIDVDKKD
jgi:hypothetical protein